MTKRVKKIYNSAKSNSLFLQDIYEVDSNNITPEMITTKTKKITFVAIYYGWLIGKYGKNWESHIKNKN